MDGRSRVSTLTNDTFWELHRKLGERYELDLAPLRIGGLPPPARRTSYAESGGRISSNLNVNGSVDGFIMDDKRSNGSKDSGGSPRSRQNRLSDRSQRASSVKGFRNVTGSTPSAPVEPPPTFLDTPTRDKSTASAMSSSTAPLKSALARSNHNGSGDQLHEDLAPRATWMKQGLKSVPKVLAKKASMFSVADTLSSPTPLQSEVAEPPSLSVFHPGGRIRTGWDILTVIWLLHDIIFIPLQFFDLPQTGYLEVLGWSTIVFWSMDIMMSFFTGIYRKGILVMDPSLVARQYARTWFPVDVLLVSLDWIAMMYRSSGHSEGQNVLWILRLLRLVRVVRLGKMTRTAMVLQEAMQGWAVNVQYSMAINIARLLLVNHMIACAWWGFSHIGGKADGWSTRYQVEDEGLLYGYATSLHWAIAQLGVGSTEIEATNAPERIFSIGVALLALITFSTMVSSMTSMMTSWYKSKEEETRHFTLLQRYLLHNDISASLSQRITKFLQHAYAAHHQASSQDMHVPLLEMLSRPLMNELQLEKHQESMKALPFLNAVLGCTNVQTLDVMRTVACSSFSTVTVAAKDVVFCCGVEAVTAYLPISGAVSYIQEARPAKECLHVWTAEMCLWTEWYFVGDLVATDVSRILILDMNSYCQAIAGNPMTHGLAVQYAAEYTSSLRNQIELSDLWQLESEPEVHDFMVGRGFMPELVFNSFGKQRGISAMNRGLGGLGGMVRVQVVPDQIFE